MWLKCDVRELKSAHATVLAPAKLLPINTWARASWAIQNGEPFSNKLVSGVPGLNRCLPTFAVLR